MDIACALRWEVALVGGNSLLGVAHPSWDNPFKYRVDTGGQRLDEVVIAKRADM